MARAGEGFMADPQRPGIRIRTSTRERPPEPAAAPPAPDKAAAEATRSSARVLVRPVRRWGDVGFRWLVLGAALALLALTLVVFYELFSNARPLIVRDGLSFVWKNQWNVERDLFGARALLLGTLITSAIAIALAVPVALGVALFTTEVAPRWLRRPVSSLVELLAAVPSVAFGFWGLLVLGPIFKRHVDPILISLLGWTGLFARPDFGVSLFLAGVVLAIMILPIVAAIAREVFTVVPRAQREAALALGATKWETVRMAVLPYSRSGVIGGVVLGLGRAMGETMAVVFVIGNSPVIQRNLLAPGASITAQIANTFQEVSTTGHQLAALLYLALILFFITLIVNMAARLLVMRANRLAGGVR
jgi:phosphate transport system permease protein